MAARTGVSTAVRCLSVTLLAMVLSGCETLQFYQQAVWGQWRLLNARVPLADSRRTEALAPEVRARLALAEDILAFAARELGLPPDGRYRSYVPLDQEYVVWNVFAAGPFDLSGRRWCYPVVGCAPYRGYFSEAKARAVAERYTRRGLETYVGGVPAYSTLGWFDDPLLSTFILWPEPDLANLLIHEMAHSRLWVRGDVAFNESFAEFVGNRGAQAWLAARDRTDAWQAWRERRAGWRAFRAFVVLAKAHLTSVYAQPEPAAAKAAAFTELRACYQAHRSLLGDGRYDALMARHFNNAFLVSVGTYADWLPAFDFLFKESGETWPQFYAAVQRLAELPAADRTRRLAVLAEQQKTQHGDDGRAQQVNCKPFFSHGADAEAAG